MNCPLELEEMKGGAMPSPPPPPPTPENAARRVEQTLLTGRKKRLSYENTILSGKETLG